MKEYRVDLHLHTCLSPCGSLEMSPQRIVETALERGLDAIAVTPEGKRSYDCNSMNNLSFHITDITANSIRANASEIGLSVEEQDTRIVIRITDNGSGMDAETARRVTNPFYTTRTTRKVGLGLPFLIQNAEQTGGSVTLTSEPGKGTEVRAVFHSDHIDCPPWGDLPGTVALLITGNPEINVCFEYRSGETGYSISTNEIKEILDGVPLSYPKVMLLIKEMIKENIRS